jgi:predicted metal-binding membrane protein
VPLLAFLCAAAIPVALWHDAIAAIAADFRLDAGYLTGWSGFGLIAAGLVLLLPVVLSARLSPASRLYPRFRNAYMGWGVSLYVMGLGLASQVAAAVG